MKTSWAYLLLLALLLTACGAKTPATLVKDDAALARTATIALLPVEFTDTFLLAQEQAFVGRSVRELMAERLRQLGYQVTLPAQLEGGTAMRVTITYIQDERTHPLGGLEDPHPDMFLHGTARLHAGDGRLIFERQVVGSGATKPRHIALEFESYTGAQRDLVAKLTAPLPPRR